MNARSWKQLLPLTLIIVLIALTLPLLITARAQNVASSNTVELHFGNDTYLLLFKISSPMFVPAENKISLNIQGILVYATSSKPIFVVVDIKLSNMNLASAIMGYYSFTRPSKTVHIEAVIPPTLTSQIRNNVKPSVLILQVKAYRNSTSAVSSINIPIVLAKMLPRLQVEADFGSGLPYAIAVIGKQPYVDANIRVTNSGPIPVHDVNLLIEFMNGSSLSMHLTDILNPGNTVSSKIHLPVPLRPGTYVVKIVADAIAGVEEVKRSSTLVLIVIPPVSVSLSALNSTTLIEGQKLCLKVESAGIPKFVHTSLAIDIRKDNEEWSTIAIIQNTSRTIYCWKVPVLGFSNKVVYQIRARLVLSIYGLQYIVGSNVIEIHVLPLQSIIRYASLQVAPEKTKVYPAENIVLDITLSPSIPVCIPVTIEKYSMTLSSWEPLGIIEVCAGKGVFKYSASVLGTGIQRLRALLRIGGFIITSNIVAINIVKQPEISVRLTPSIVAPNSSTTLMVSLQRLIGSYEVVVKPSWTNASLSINATGNAEIPLKAPSSEGIYHVYVRILVDGYSVEKDLILQVAKVTASLTATPELIKAGEAKNITIHVSTTPPINGSVVVKLSSKGQAIAVKRFNLVNGKGKTTLPAPNRPGNYSITATIQPYGIVLTKSIRVIKIIYGLSLSLNSTSVPADSPVQARITITPAPKTPVNIVLMLRKKGEAWQVIASGLAVSGKASIVFKAPKTPGSYEVQASATQLGATSNIVELKVSPAHRAAPPRQLQVYAIIGIVAAAALAWSIRSIRR